ncbi:host attachment protein (plasmid) [Sinorhizobium meliloti]|nr:host attachment protein [Sinorhizobium meliloti]
MENTARIVKDVNLLKDGRQQAGGGDISNRDQASPGHHGRQTRTQPFVVGHGRSAMEYSSDPYARTTSLRRGNRREARPLCHDQAFENLVICAAPRTLGDLRKLLSHQVKEKTLAEIDRNCVAVPTDQLIATVKSVVFPG